MVRSPWGTPPGNPPPQKTLFGTLQKGLPLNSMTTFLEGCFFWGGSQPQGHLSGISGPPGRGSLLE
eukprot:54037-Pyramimonas_sp.AAC.1